MPHRTKSSVLVTSLGHAFVSCFGLGLATLLRFDIIVRLELDRGVQLYQIGGGGGGLCEVRMSN